MHQRHTPSENGDAFVWDFPATPAAESCRAVIEIVSNQQVIAQTVDACRVLERGYPPLYYIPSADIRAELLIPTAKTARCQWKGVCRYYHLLIADQTIDYAAWTYERPNPSFAMLREHFSFYSHLMDGCYVDGQRVQPRHGDSYGGWIT